MPNLLSLTVTGTTQTHERYQDECREQSTEQCEPQVNTAAPADHRHDSAQMLLAGGSESSNRFRIIMHSNTMKQNPSREGNSRSAAQEIPHLL
jgi:hypothetical protein